MSIAGSVLYRWDATQRRVTGECDISRLIPRGDDAATCVSQGKISGECACAVRLRIT